MNTVTCKITDAVSEFRAEWESGRSLIYKVKINGDLKFSNFIPLANLDSWGHICSEEEFEARVLDMTVNYGESSLKQLEAWQEGLKRQSESDEQHADKLNEMDIDWSKAPEGTTHWMPNGYEWSEAFLSISDSGKVKVFRGGAWYEASNQHSVYSLTKLGLEAKPEAQPVFTQAMANNGELPQVGSKFYHQGKIVKTLSTSNEEGGVVTFLDGTDIGCCWNNSSWVIPIDTRTKKEKAIDEIREEYIAYTGEAMGAFEFAYDKWVGE